jgi:hypothetical protein
MKRKQYRKREGEHCKGYCLKEASFSESIVMGGSNGWVEARRNKVQKQWTIRGPFFLEQSEWGGLIWKSAERKDKLNKDRKSVV